MNPLFNAEKLDFFIKLRKDGLVQSLNAEGKIRESVDTIVHYLEDANKAYCRMNPASKASFRKGVLERSLCLRRFPIDLYMSRESYESFLSHIFEPMNLDFDDVRSIAYNKGIYESRKRGILDIFLKKNPLGPLLNEYKRYYLNFLMAKEVDSKMFNEDVILSLKAVNKYMADGFGCREDIKFHLLFSEYLPDKDVLSSCDAEILDKSSKISNEIKNHTERELKLLSLANSGREIIRGYAEENSDKLRRGLKNKDWSWLTSMWSDDRMPLKDVAKFARCFRSQALINYILFEMLYSSFADYRIKII